LVLGTRFDATDTASEINCSKQHYVGAECASAPRKTSERCGECDCRSLQQGQQKHLAQWHNRAALNGVVEGPPGSA
jgi:hypothetical protein